MLCRAVGASSGVLWGSLQLLRGALWENEDLGPAGVEAVKKVQSLWKKPQHCSGPSSSAGPSEGGAGSDFGDGRGFVDNLRAVSPGHVQGCCLAVHGKWGRIRLSVAAWSSGPGAGSGPVEDVVKTRCVLQCPPCRSLTRVLVESYHKIKEAGQKFEILFVSADR